MKLYLGTSGWQYYHWQNNFYPQNLKSKNFLNFYSQYFNTVEVNTTFYHFVKEATLKNWTKQVPKNFLFSIKLHRLFTHFRRLKLGKEDQRILKETIKSYQILGKNLGPILIQLSPSLKKDIKLLKRFLKILKNINSQRFKFNNKVCKSSSGSSQQDAKYAIEFRHKSWLDKEVYKILKENKIAFVISDSPRWSTDIIKTADFIYVRFHGKPKLFASLYHQEELKEWIVKLKKLRPRKMYVYFNNDFKGYAVKNALEFKELANF